MKFKDRFLIDSFFVVVVVFENKLISSVSFIEMKLMFWDLLAWIK